MVSSAVRESGVRLIRSECIIVSIANRRSLEDGDTHLVGRNVDGGSAPKSGSLEQEAERMLSSTGGIGIPNRLRNCDKRGSHLESACYFTDQQQETSRRVIDAKTHRRRVSIPFL